MVPSFILPELHLILPFGPMLALSLEMYVIQFQLAPKEGGMIKDPVWKLGIHLGIHLCHSSNGSFL